MEAVKELDSHGRSFAPTLLLSMPQLADPNFHRSVILLCEHGAEGAMQRPGPEGPRQGRARGQ